MRRGKNKLLYNGLALFLTWSLVVTGGDFTSADAATITKQAREVTKLVNKERTKRNRGKLTLDTKLTKAANKRAKECAKLFSHTRPNGESCFTILDHSGISYGTCGENIAAGQPASSQVMDSWMHSSGHKKNILTKDFKKIGVGYYKKKNSAYQYYWVQIFTD